MPPQLLEAVTSRTIDGPSLDDFWAWLNSRYRDQVPTGLPEDWCDLLEAVSCNDPLRLGTLAQHQNPWVRIAVAGNRASPEWAIWGDGVSGFGLVDDRDDWVAAAALLSMPHPPAAVVEAIASASSHSPHGSTSVVDTTPRNRA